MMDSANDDANMSSAIKDVWGRLNISFSYGDSGILSRVETMLWRCFVMLCDALETWTCCA